MMIADSFGFAYMYSTALRRALITPRMKSPRVFAASAVVTPTTFESGGRTPGAAATIFYFPRLLDPKGAVIGTAAIPPAFEPAQPAPNPPRRLGGARPFPAPAL